MTKLMMFFWNTGQQAQGTAESGAMSKGALIIIILIAAAVLAAVLIFAVRCINSAIWKKRRKLREKLIALENDSEVRTVSLDSAGSEDEQIEAAASQILGTRDSQQDSFYISADSIKFDLLNTSYIAAAVCDGMGGLSSGEAASRIAVDCIKKSFDSFLKNPDESISNMLKKTVLEANDEVYNYGIKNCGGQMCGTTMVFALLESNNLYWASVGDSRIYIIRDKRIVQITNDHNYAYTLNNKVKQGLMTQDEALREPNREALISFIGMEELDIADISINPIKLLKGDIVLLCSDGLTKIMSDVQICDFVSRNSENIDELAELLPLKASDMHSGSQDNTTVAVIMYK